METEKEDKQDNKELTKLRIDEDSSPTIRVELREATPDSIPLPVREKFEVLRIEEDQPEQKVSCAAQVETSEIATIAKTITSPVDESPDENEKTNTECQRKMSTEFIEKVSESATQTGTHKVIDNRAFEQLDENVINEKIINKQIAAVENSKTKPEHAEEFNELETYSNLHQPECSVMSKATVEESEAEVIYRSVQLRHDNSDDRIRNTERVKVSSYVVETPRCAYQDRATFIESFTSSQHRREITPIPMPRTERDTSPPAPPIRRRSVKDIIESINRNQQLLKTSNPPDDPRTSFMKNERSLSFSIHDPRRFEEISSSEKRVELLLDDLRNFRKSSK